MAKNKGTEERVKAWVAELLAHEEQEQVREGRRETIDDRCCPIFGPHRIPLTFTLPAQRSFATRRPIVV